jgi:hypothetical protein
MFARVLDSQAPLYLPLAHVALCLDCEVCFDLAMRRCPACGGATLACVASLLDSDHSWPAGSSWSRRRQRPDDLVASDPRQRHRAALADRADPAA